MKFVKLKFLADEDFDHDILRGLKRKDPLLDITTVQAARQLGRDDLEILSWAAREGRVVLSHERHGTHHRRHPHLGVCKCGRRD